jgi:hypothetical protein
MPANSVLRDIQLKLRASLILTDGILLGARQDDSHVRVILFPARMSHKDRLAIHHYIKQRIQYHIDQLNI